MYNTKYMLTIEAVMKKVDCKKNKSKKILVSYWQEIGEKGQEKLAKKVKRKVNYLRTVFFCFNKCSAKTAIDIDKATAGKITKETLRPDYF